MHEGVQNTEYSYTLRGCMAAKLTKFDNASPLLHVVSCQPSCLGQTKADPHRPTGGGTPSAKEQTSMQLRNSSGHLANTVAQRYRHPLITH